MFSRHRNHLVKPWCRAAGLLPGVLLLGMTVLSHGQPKPRTHSISIEAMRFMPEKLEVNAGDTVIWKNQDPFPHNATAEGKGFASGDIQGSQSWKFRTGKKGEFPYVCTLHPGMKAVLIVK